jgi:hypothetical protein
MQALALDTLEKEPDMQDVQALEPEALEYDPGWHDITSTEPVGHAFPAAHRTWLDGVLQTYPEAHFVWLLEPSGQKYEELHSTGVTDPATHTEPKGQITCDDGALQ